MTKASASASTSRPLTDPARGSADGRRPPGRDQVDRRPALADLDRHDLADVAARARDALPDRTERPRRPATQGVHAGDFTRGKTLSAELTVGQLVALLASVRPPA
jgi:hypothetical protein